MRSSEVSIPVGSAHLCATLSVPQRPLGVVLFAHGSGSSRHSSRNRQVASVLVQAGFTTLLMDLLTEEEARIDATNGELRFDIPLLAERLSKATDWVCAQAEFADMTIGYFGASTGAAAALMSAALRRDISAVVCRGGRPDLAGPALREITTPTLLVVGGHDHIVMKLNEEAFHHLTSRKAMLIIPRATHLFEETGALEQVSQAARDWFTSCMSQAEISHVA